MARIYSNENFSLLVVNVLRELGHDVLTSQECGQAGRRIPDPEVLEFACSDQRAVITYNRDDFRRLHTLRSDHHGIIICTTDRDFVRQAHRIHQALTDVVTLRGELIRVNRPSAES